MGRLIEVVNYQAGWAQRYQGEAGLLRDVFGEALVRIHHIGSTAIPDMRAKPVIDILIEIEPGIAVDRFNPRMRQLGYDCRGECLAAVMPGTPGRFYFSKNVDGSRYCHVHVCHVGHFQISEFLVLREYLGSHCDEAAKYGDLKSCLAKQFPHDNIGYMRGNDEFVKQLIIRATEWSKTIGKGMRIHNHKDWTGARNDNPN